MLGNAEHDLCTEPQVNIVTFTALRLCSVETTSLDWHSFGGMLSFVVAQEPVLTPPSTLDPLLSFISRLSLEENSLLPLKAYTTCCRRSFF
jgi:hypothetical protein